MLVLVLILVVIALVLLLAGWFLHLVVLAWTSVGISVLAGLVLLYDWWQTRSAVRAGRQSGGARDGDVDRPASQGAGATSMVGAGAAGAGMGPDGFGGADMEPATQVLPIVPPATNAAEQTVVMPVVAPSSSADAPSGASRSGGLSSQSVTETTSDESVPARAADGATTAVDPAAGPEPGGGGDPASGIEPPGESRSDRAREAGSGSAGAARTSERTSDEEPATTAAPAGGESATRAVSASDAAAGSGTAAGTAGSSGAATVGGAVAAGGAVAGGAALAGGAGAAGGSTPGQPEGRPDDGTIRADRGSVAGAAAGDDPTAVAAGGPGGAGGVGNAEPPGDDRTRSAIDTSGEAPEEPRDPAHASLVARLPDEVVVIDEHPRYHVQGCPSLPGQAVIPLPVSEAVDLGFTPCGWCSPNRVLSERHPAEAR